MRFGSVETLTINVIFESEDGTLWLAGNEGAKEKRAVVLSFRETRLSDDKLGGSDTANDNISRPRPKIGFTRYSLPNAASNIETVTEDNSGNLLFGGYNLFLKFDGDTFQRILPLGSTQRGPGWYKPLTVICGSAMTTALQYLIRSLQFRIMGQ